MPTRTHRQDSVKRRFCMVITAVSVLVTFATSAHARQVEFVSQHPVPHKYGGGFCYIDVPHVHNYEPGDRRMYREAQGRHYFVGDPAPFDYDGPRYSYYGAHPVADAEVQLGHLVFCYIKGPHYHWYQPPPQAQFQMSGGAYWYVGAFPQTYYDERPRYAVINEAYAPMPYARPVVDVAVAPPVVAAEISLGGPGWAAHAVIGAPMVPVAPVPVAPVPVAPVPVAPVQIGVGINLGGPVVGGPPAVIERREVIYEDRYRHDRGRHEGWRDRPHVEERHGRPARFIAGPAPVQQPLLRRGAGPAPQFASPPHRGPAAAPAQHGPAPAPRLQPAPARAPIPPAQNRGASNHGRGH